MSVRSNQNVYVWNQEVTQRFLSRPSADGPRLNLSWSNWGFGMEPLAASARRLERAGIRWIELHGNHYGPDLGYRGPETVRILGDHGIRCAGICGMFSAECDLSSPSGVVRQRAVDYLKRTIEFAAGVGAGYILVVPGAVGRPQAYDASEYERSAATLRLVADRFGQSGIKAAIEPIRAAETSFCHTIEDAARYLSLVGHPDVAHINGDVYHMQSEERHIGLAILEAGDRLTNLHMADSNRRALGEGSLDLDTVIRALYAIGYNRDGCFCTPEPLGPGGDPYPAMHGQPDPEALDQLVFQTVRYFKEREEVVRCDTCLKESV
jgi:D-psicose/D-tagatose/L-ribulose 3-epimerase